MVMGGRGARLSAGFSGGDMYIGHIGRVEKSSWKW